VFISYSEVLRCHRTNKREIFDFWQEGSFSQWF